MNAVNLPTAALSLGQCCLIRRPSLVSRGRIVTLSKARLTMDIHMMALLYEVACEVVLPLTELAAIGLRQY